EAYGARLTTPLSESWTDSGPPVLAALVAAARPGAAEVCERALIAWLHALEGDLRHTSAVGGLAGYIAGCRLANTVSDRLSSLASVLSQALDARTSAAPWRVTNLAWEDYDLILGPAGVVLALAASINDMPGVHAAAQHLIDLCDSDDLTRLRVGAYSGD